MSKLAFQSVKVLKNIMSNSQNDVISESYRENLIEEHEEFLEGICFKQNPSVLDDDIPDFFNNWLGELTDGELEALIAKKNEPHLWDRRELPDAELIKTERELESLKTI